ncbi:hypothetical protein F5877DRAFT_72040 [Lentinula edodes]|nr:hypothetical protein F5877DRAFT_72040 [Lentinula edodes]
MSSTNSVPSTTSPSNTGNTSPPSTRDSHPSTTPSTTTTTTPSTDSTSSSSNYPAQHHAGAVGYGPNYRQGPSLTDKLSGLKEELKGKVTKNPQMVEHGKEMKTGEVKRREQQEDMNGLDPFGTADDDDDEKEKKKDDSSTTDSVNRTDSNAPSTTHSQPTTQSNTNPSPAFSTPNASVNTLPQLPHPINLQLSASTTRDAQGQHLPSPSSSLNTDGAIVTPPATTTESGSGMAKPRDVKYIDEDGSGEHHHQHHHHHHHSNKSNKYDGRSNAVASEPGDIARDSVHM